MKILKWILTTLGTMFLGMFGGQKNKGARRFGIPGFALTVSFTNGFKIKHIVLLGLIPVLLIGYGEHSWLAGLCPSDTVVRIVYGALLSFPFWFYGWLRGIIATISLIGAFSVRAGSLGSVGGFDFLIEDMVRYGVLGLLISYNLFVSKKEGD